MATHSYISLFSGAAGLDLAIRLALPDARCLCYVENEATAVRILAARIKEGSLDDAPVWSDARTFPSEMFRGKVAGIIGGFPCTDLSVAGRQAGITGEKSGLWFDYARIIREVQPGWVYIENVPPVLHLGNGDAVLGELARLGFDAEWGTLPAAGVGASHLRKRVFILAYRRGERRQQIPRSASGHEGADEGWISKEGHIVTNGICSLALTPERGCRILREPSGGNGLTDGGGGYVDHAASARCDGREPGQGRSIRNGARRTESGRRSDAVGHAECPERRPHVDGRGCVEPRADSEGEATGGAGERGEAVGDTNLSYDHRTRNTGPRRRGESANHDGDMGHTVSTGLEGWQGQPGDAGEELAPIERAGDGLGIFAPGPDDPRWQDVLVRNFGLRPALAQAEIEQHFRGVADGMASLVVSSRTDAIRAEGNGVVAIQGAAMFRELSERIMAAKKGGIW